DHVGKLFAHLAKQFVHWAYRIQILLGDGIQATASFRHVALQSAQKAEVIRGVNVNLDVTDVAYLADSQYQDSFNNNDWFGGNPGGFTLPPVGAEVINRLFDASAFSEGQKVTDKQLVVETVRMIEVHLGAQFCRHGVSTAVITVMLQMRY